MKKKLTRKCICKKLPSEPLEETSHPIWIEESRVTVENIRKGFSHMKERNLFCFCTQQKYKCYFFKNRFSFFRILMIQLETNNEVG